MRVNISIEHGAHAARAITRLEGVSKPAFDSTMTYLTSVEVEEVNKMPIYNEIGLFLAAGWSVYQPCSINLDTEDIVIHPYMTIYLTEAADEAVAQSQELNGYTPGIMRALDQRLIMMRSDLGGWPWPDVNISGSTLMAAVPHAITIKLPDGGLYHDPFRENTRPFIPRLVKEIIDTKTITLANAGRTDIRTRTKRFGRAVALPPRMKNVIWVVSNVIAQAFPERDDFFVPGDIERDDTGKILGSGSIDRVLYGKE